VTRLLWEGIESAVLGLLLLLLWPVGRWWWSNYGSTAAERDGRWPGDHLLDGTAEVYTRAIAIEAPPERVWAWLVQLGLDRAGFYSYELMERALGITVTNYEYIDPAWQTRQAGEPVKFHPKQPGIPVALVEPGVCLGFGQKPHEVHSGVGWAWSLYIQPTATSPHACCRLIVRDSYQRPNQRSLLRRSLEAIEAPIDFLMERRMLRTIKRLAESSPELHLG
jgi:hypothetical protein